MGSCFTLAAVVAGIMVPVRPQRSARGHKRRAVSGCVLAVLALVNAQAVLKVLGSYCLLLAGQRLKRKLRQLLFTSILARTSAGSRHRGQRPWWRSSRRIRTRCRARSRRRWGWQLPPPPRSSAPSCSSPSSPPSDDVVRRRAAGGAFAALASRTTARCARRRQGASTASAVGAATRSPSCPQSRPTRKRRTRRRGTHRCWNKSVLKHHLIFHKADLDSAADHEHDGGGTAFAGTLVARGLVGPRCSSPSRISMSLRTASAHPLPRRRSCQAARCRRAPQPSPSGHPRSRTAARRSTSRRPSSRRGAPLGRHLLLPARASDDASPPPVLGGPSWRCPPASDCARRAVGRRQDDRRPPAR